MKLDQAIEILNTHRYRGKHDWAVSTVLEGEPLEPLTFPPGMQAWGLTSFEATAIAEKLDRDAGTPAPPTAPTEPAPAKATEAATVTTKPEVVAPQKPQA